MMQQMLVAGGGGGPTLIEAITTAGLTSNLQLCLDAGDAVSYTSGQKWLDRSGGGYDFFLGSTSSADGEDPSFVGTAGVRGSYFLFSNGDEFAYDTTNETWMQNLHKNNAVFSVVAMYYQNGASDFIDFLRSAGPGGSPTGVSIGTFTTRKPQIVIYNSASVVLSVIGDTAMSASGWHMVGYSLNEATGAGGGFMYSDGNYNQVSSSNTFNSTYTSPSAGNAADTMRIGDSVLDGQRLSCLAVWNTALTKANMDTIWAAMRGRFGI